MERKGMCVSVWVWVGKGRGLVTVDGCVKYVGSGHVRTRPTPSYTYYS